MVPKPACGGKGAKNSLSSSSSLCSSFAAQVPGTISVLLPSGGASCCGLWLRRSGGRAAGPAWATGRLLYLEGRPAPAQGAAAAPVQSLPPLPKCRLMAPGQPRISPVGFAPFAKVVTPVSLTAELPKGRQDALPIAKPDS